MYAASTTGEECFVLKDVEQGRVYNFHKGDEVLLRHVLSAGNATAPLWAGLALVSRDIKNDITINHNRLHR